MQRILKDHFAQASGHVKEAREAIARQAGVIKELEICGIDTSEAELLLAELHRRLIQRIEERDRILAELDRLQ